MTEDAMTLTQPNPPAVTPNPRIHAFEAADHITISMAGRSRTGKTRRIIDLLERWGTARVLIINCEDGLTSLSDVRPKPTIYDLLTEEEKLTLSPQAMADKYVDELRQAWAYLRANSTSYDWWVLDGATYLTDTMRDLCERQRENGEYKTAKGGDDVFGMWGEIALKQQRLFRAYRGLPINGYINLLAEVEYEKEPGSGKPTGRKWTEPAVSGRQTAERYNSWWDVNGYTYREVRGDGSLTYCVDLQGDEGIRAGSRIPPGRLPRRMENWTLTGIYDAIVKPKEA